MPATVNDRLLHSAVGHAIDLHRYGNGVIYRMIGALNRSDADLMAALQQVLDQLPDDQSAFQIARLESLLASVRQINAAAYEAVLRELPADLRDLVQYEVEYQAGIIVHTVPEPVLVRFPLARVSVDQVYAAAMSRPFQGRLLRDWFKGAEANRMQAVRNAIAQGYLQGQTTDQIYRSIRGTKAKRYQDGKLEGSRRGLRTIVQTALAHTAQTAREQVVNANADIIKAVEWVATLDNRTSPMCRIRDGKRYTPQDHKPIGHSIPWGGGPGRLHMNCRSTSVPITKSWRELGFDVDELPASTRASMDGQVPADLTYAEWLKQQSAARQDEIVGPTRGKLMREGGLPFESLFTPRGDMLTLDQLRARDAAAFRRAAA